MMGGVPVSAASRDEPIALALGAGGARGLAQIGVIEALQARGLRIVAIAGASSGALVGSACAAGKLEELLRTGKLRRMMDLADVFEIAVADWSTDPVDPFLNINTPEDLALAALHLA